MIVPNIRKRAAQMAELKMIAAGTFGGDRATDLVDIAKYFSKHNSIDLVNSLVIVMQVEREFPRRPREFIERSLEASAAYGTPITWCLMQLVKLERAKAANKPLDNVSHESVSLPVEALPDDLREEVEDS